MNMDDRVLHIFTSHDFMVASNPLLITPINYKIIMSILRVLFP